jgi:hypothetical protein
MDAFDPGVDDLGVLGIDTSRPNIARVYDWLLGGKNNFYADREEGRRLLTIYPFLHEKIWDNRRFLERALDWLTSIQDMHQILDLGAGLPASTPAVRTTHEIARAAGASARVVYVDNDPMVVSHAKALLADGTGVAAVRADLTDPASVLGHERVTAVLDLSEPVVVMLAMVLHFSPADEAAKIVAGYAERTAPGSYIVISCGSGDEHTGAALAREYMAATLYNHAPEVIAGWFGSLQLLRPPGLVDAHRWQPQTIVPLPDREGGHVLAGVARIPDRPAAVAPPLRHRPAGR